MMKRDQALSVIAIRFPEAIVVPVYQSAFDWVNIRPHPMNYLCTGAMGLASSHGLGLAIGLPEQKIIVLDGDGSLLMNLGSLVTIGKAAPKNFIHFVCCNGTYEVNGKFPIPAGARMSFSGLAQEAGYSATFSFDELSDLEANMDKIQQLDGPLFIALHVEPGVEYAADYELIHSSESRAEFRNAVKKHII